MSLVKSDLKKSYEKNAAHRFAFCKTVPVIAQVNTASCTAITSAIATENALLKGGQSFVVYPNPVKANGSLTVKGLTGNYTYTVFTISGIALQRGSITNGSIRIDNRVKAGTYILELKSTKQAIRTTILVTE